MKTWKLYKNLSIIKIGSWGNRTNDNRLDFVYDKKVGTYYNQSN